MAIQRDEYAVFFMDDELTDEPVVTYDDFTEASGVADLGGALVIHRTLFIEATDWEPCEIASKGT